MPLAVHVQHRHIVLFFARQRHDSWNTSFWCLSLRTYRCYQKGGKSRILQENPEMLVAHPTHRTRTVARRPGASLV